VAAGVSLAAMTTWSFRSRTVWIVPLVLLVVALLEDILTYKARQHVPNVYARAAVILVLNAFAFGFAGGWLAPRLVSLFKTVRTGTSRTAGTIGLWTFYVLAYGALYYAFLVVERSGTAGLLPASLR
jgi:hypothetical protein